MSSQTQIDHGYSDFLKKNNLTEKYVQELMGYLPAPIPNPSVDFTFNKRSSPIHGVGMFALRKINRGEGFLVVKNKKRSNLARFVNHKDLPNLEVYIKGEGELWCKALIDIPKGEEITMDYNNNKTKSERNT